MRASTLLLRAMVSSAAASRDQERIRLSRAGSDGRRWRQDSNQVSDHSAVGQAQRGVMATKRKHVVGIAPMAIHLEPEQKALFTALRDAVAALPSRDDREEFVFFRTFGGDSIQGNGLELDVLYEDVIALDDAGLIRVTSHHSKGNGFNFVIPTSASAAFDERSAEPSRPPSSPESPASGPEGADDPGEAGRAADPTAVMVVHGRNAEASRAMFSFLKGIGLRPLDWEELVSLTKSAAPFVGDVLTEAFGTAQAAVVLFTPDDEAKLRDELLDPEDEDHERDLTPQARPNVLFEAGMALASHPNATVLVELGRLRPFTDLGGRHAVRLNGTAAKLRSLAQRLEAAGCHVDRTREGWDDPSQFPSATTVGGAPREVPRRRTATAVAREVGYLEDDAGRWIEDRDRELVAESSQRSGEMASRGRVRSGAHLAGLTILRRGALQQYRDEISAKRRRYAELVDAAPPDADVPRFALDEASLATLARWRSPVTIPGTSDSTEVDDPTSGSRESDLRRFEQEGDPPIS